MIIASVHVMIFSSQIQFFDGIVAGAKKILHKAGIHSSTIQPEFIHSSQSVCFFLLGENNYNNYLSYRPRSVSLIALWIVKRIGVAKMKVLRKLL